MSDYLRENLWVPVFAIVAEGGNNYIKIIDWFGGTGIKPLSNLYIGSRGYTDKLNQAIPLGGSGGGGAQGPQGSQGAQGATGLQGPQGIQGALGNLGPQGFQGVLGSQGVQGSQGETGSQGDVGPQGVQGDTGFQGNIGSQGPQGEIGNQGPQGFQGSTGVQGNPGTGITIKGSLDDPSELPGSGTIGDAYLIEGDLYVWDGESWENVGNIQGPQGAQGATGAQGTQGVQGSQGPFGTQGDVGAQGAQGITGSQGPQGGVGETGNQGATGSQGPQGSQGADGPDSADEISYDGAQSGLIATNVQDAIDQAVALYNDLGWSAPNYTTENLPVEAGSGEIGYDTDESRLVVSDGDYWTSLAYLNDLGGKQDTLSSANAGTNISIGIEDEVAVINSSPFGLQDTLATGTTFTEDKNELELSSSGLSIIYEDDEGEDIEINGVSISNNAGIPRIELFRGSGGNYTQVHLRLNNEFVNGAAEVNLPSDSGTLALKEELDLQTILEVGNEYIGIDGTETTSTIISIGEVVLIKSDSELYSHQATTNISPVEVVMSSSEGEPGDDKNEADSTYTSQSFSIQVRQDIGGGDIVSGAVEVEGLGTGDGGIISIKKAFYDSSEEKDGSITNLLVTTSKSIELDSYEEVISELPDKSGKLAVEQDLRKYKSIIPISSNTTISTDHEGCLLIISDAGPVNLTFNSSSLEVGQSIDFIDGSVTTLVEDSSTITRRSDRTLVTEGLNGISSVLCIGEGAYYAVGDLITI